MVLNCLDDIFNCCLIFIELTLDIAGIVYSPIASDMLANVFWSYFSMCCTC